MIIKLKDFIKAVQDAKSKGTREKKEEIEDKALYIRKGGEPFKGNNPFFLYMQGARPGLYVPFCSTYKRNKETKKRERLYNISEAPRYWVTVPKIGKVEKKSDTGLVSDEKQKEHICGITYGQVINIEDLLPVETYSVKQVSEEEHYIKDMLALQSQC